MKYNFNDYKFSTIKFAEETVSWNDIETNKFYIAVTGDWMESCDNVENGLSVSWAFGLTKTEIEKQIAKHFITEITSLIDIMCDNLEDDLEFYTERIRELTESLNTII